ncbi:MAG: hypothetical protein HYY06_31250 [Deltaproteobacteria bacterium]|nr:hypothetical protein [Deltaproteobacteria bacterium]
MSDRRRVLALLRRREAARAGSSRRSGGRGDGRSPGAAPDPVPSSNAGADFARARSVWYGTCPRCSYRIMTEHREPDGNVRCPDCDLVLDEERTFYCCDVELLLEPR